MKLTNLIFSKFESDPYTASILSMFGVNSLLLLGVFASVCKYVCLFSDAFIEEGFYQATHCLARCRIKVFSQLFKNYLSLSLKMISHKLFKLFDSPIIDRIIIPDFSISYFEKFIELLTKGETKYTSSDVTYQFLSHFIWITCQLDSKHFKSSKDNHGFRSYSC